MVYSSFLRGCGAYLPQKILSNADLAKKVDTSDEWITKRTGIKQRHIAAEGELTSDLATKAAKDCLKNAGMTIKDIDAILVATTTPDNTFPATAVKVQANLDMHHGFAFDLQAVCSGFIYGLSIADNMIKSGQVKTVLLIGAETFSRILDWEDRNTCVLFGDGAGAVILQAQEGTPKEKGILSTHLHSDGTLYEHLYTTGGASSSDKVGHVHMNGREVYKHAVEKLGSVVVETLEKHNLTGEDIDWLVPHQANQRIIDATRKRLDLPENKVILTVSQHANTSAASVPLALHEGITSGKILPGQLLLLEALGAGLTWGSTLLRL